MSKTPEPGIYPDVDFATYLDWHAVNNSSLGPAERSMAHYKAALDNPKPSTPAQRLGSFVHAGVLEPLLILARYAVMPPYHLDSDNLTDKGQASKSRTTNICKAKEAGFLAAHPDQAIVEQADYDRLLGMAKSLKQHEETNVWLLQPANLETEVSIVWNDATTRLLCKARLDCLNRCGHLKHYCPFIAELKTDKDASQFDWSIWRWGYHRQAAFYSDGWYALTGHVPIFRVIVMETCPPYAVRCARHGMAPSTIDVGRKLYVSALKQIAACRQSGVWPGYEDLDYWKLPERKMPKPVARHQLTRNGEPVTVGG